MPRDVNLSANPPGSSGNPGPPGTPGRSPSLSGDGPGFNASVWGSLWPVLVGLAVALLMHVTLPAWIGAYHERTVMNIGMAIILAVSLNIVNGLTGQFSIGHAGFMALGGYTAGCLTKYVSLYLWSTSARHGGMFGSGEWLFVAACLLGGVVAAVAGYVVGLPSLRLRGDYLAIVTLGFGEIIRVVLQQTNPTIGSQKALLASSWSQWLPPPVGGSLGFDGVPKYSTIFWVYAFAAVTVIAAYRLKVSSMGRAMIAIREDEIAAQAMGVNITRQKVWAFVLAAFFAGLAGGLAAHQFGNSLSPQDAGFQKSFDFVIMTVLGGKGSITGVILSATIITLLPEVLRDFDSYRLIVFALLMIVMMLLRPQGLLGVREMWDFFPTARPSAQKGGA